MWEKLLVDLGVAAIFAVVLGLAGYLHREYKKATKMPWEDE